MTLATKNSSLTNSSVGSSCSRCRPAKDVPKKRAVSFLEPVKFHAPRPQEETDFNPDADRDHLQATNKRRRYMRRGSKCPSMLLGMASFKSLMQDAMSEDADINNHETTAKTMLHQHATSTFKAQLQQARRLSLMSALKVSLESSCSVAASSQSAGTASSPLRATILPPPERRMSTFQLLSSAMEEVNDDVLMMS
jgi:hypothetical protein